MAPRLVTLLVFAGLLPGCGSAGKTFYPVSGEVYVDGSPAKDLFIYLHPLDDSTPERLMPFAQTDAQGQFTLSSRVSGDGAPAGKYKVTFEWREASGLLKNQFDGPDRLEGRYAKPETSEYTVEIEKKTNVLPRFNLTRKGKS